MRHSYEFPFKSVRWYVHMEHYFWANAIMNANVTYNMANPTKQMRALQFRDALVDTMLGYASSLQVDMYKERRLDNRVLLPCPPEELRREFMDQPSHVLGPHKSESGERVSRICRQCRDGRRVHTWCLHCHVHLHPECLKPYHLELIEKGGVHKDTV